MTAQTCLFCSLFEYKSEVDFICDSCVQLLLDADQSELKRAYKKAIEKDYSNKARAIESFMTLEEFNVRETKEPKRSFIRKKPMRMVRPTCNQLRP